MKKKDKEIALSTRDVSILIFWAEYGVGKAIGGSYEEDILRIIKTVAPCVGLKGSKYKTVEFGKHLLKVYK